MATLWNRKMGNFLNLVYDDWDYNTLNPGVNGEKNFGKNKFRRIEKPILDRLGYLNYNCFRLNDVYETPNENFYYFISILSGLNQFLENGELPLSKEVYDCFKQTTNLHIVFYNYVEVESEYCINKTESIIKELNLDPSRFWMINNNTRLDEFKKRGNLLINVYSSKMVGVDASIDLSQFGPFNFKTEKEGCFFMCQNRRPKAHRYGILCSLLKNNLLYDTDWSLTEGWDYNKENFRGFYSSIFNDSEIDELLPEIAYFGEIKCKLSDYEKNKSWFSGDNGDMRWGCRYDRKTFEESYVNIATETNFDSDDIHITEKSFKPFYFYQYPLILATQDNIKMLKQYYDFDFFEDMINIEYDSEPDHRKRFMLFVEEVKRIHKLKNWFIESYPKNYERFILNQSKLFNIKNNKDDYNFFDYLRNLSPMSSIKTNKKLI